LVLYQPLERRKCCWVPSYKRGLNGDEKVEVGKSEGGGVTTVKRLKGARFEEGVGEGGGYRGPSARRARKIVFGFKNLKVSVGRGKTYFPFRRAKVSEGKKNKIEAHCEQSASKVVTDMREGVEEENVEG